MVITSIKRRRLCFRILFICMSLCKSVCGRYVCLTNKVHKIDRALGTEDGYLREDVREKTKKKANKPTKRQRTCQ